MSFRRPLKGLRGGREGREERERDVGREGGREEREREERGREGEGERGQREEITNMNTSMYRHITLGRGKQYRNIFSHKTCIVRVAIILFVGTIFSNFGSFYHLRVLILVDWRTINN